MEFNTEIVTGTNIASLVRVRMFCEQRGKFTQSAIVDTVLALFNSGITGGIPTATRQESIRFLEGRGVINVSDRINLQSMALQARCDAISEACELFERIICQYANV